MILQELRAAVLAALADHGLDQPKTFFARVAKTVGNRLSVQKIDSKDGADDFSPIEVWPGVPGVSSDPKDGETVAVTLVGQKQVPIVTHRSPPTAPLSSEVGPVPTCPLPLNVRHDAEVSIRMLSRSDLTAKMYVGLNGATAPVALSPPVDSLQAALVTFASALSVATTVAHVAAAGTALNTALGAIPSSASTKLEA